MNIHPPAFPPPLNASVILPDELITEIVLRLNVKSLMALKCVSESWFTFISDPLFVKMHLNLSKRNPYLALHSVQHAFSIPNTFANISVSRLLKSTSNSIYRYFLFSRIHFDGMVGSCNGLICFHYYYGGAFGSQKGHLFYFWNPATRTQSETSLSLPWRPKTHTPVHDITRFGFGYDNSTDTYKLVMLGFRKEVATTVKVFTLGDNIWRDIQSFFPVQVVLCSGTNDFKYDGTYLSNSISWLVQKNLTIEKFVIVSLDLGTETYTQLLLPSCCDELPLHNSTICVLMDHICFSHDFKGTHFVIWQMKEFGVEESWTQFLKISYSNLGLSYELGCQLLPLCLCESGATLILATTNATRKRSQAILYNWRDNSVKKKTKRTSRIRWCASKDYVESLVSTC